MRNEIMVGEKPQHWIAERWIKHSDSASIVRQFAHRSSWNQLSLPDEGHNVVAMRSLAAALANEGLPQWLDASRLAWRMAVGEADHRSLVQICCNLSELGRDPMMTPELQSFRQRSYSLALALCKNSRWTVGSHIVSASWARVLRNVGDVNGFSQVCRDLDKPRVLREMLSSEATAVQRFQVVQTLALFELERSTGASRLDWILGLMVELGADVEAGSTAMRVLLVESELAVKQGNFNRAFVGALQLTHHMVNADSELCSRAELAGLYRSISERFTASHDKKTCELASSVLATDFPSTVQQVDSLARDMDRISVALPPSMRATLPRLAPRTQSAPAASGVVLPFTSKR